MATHGGRHMPQPDISQTGQGAVAQVIQALSNTREVPKGTCVSTGEDVTAIGHVAPQDEDVA